MSVDRESPTLGVQMLAVHMTSQALAVQSGGHHHQAALEPTLLPTLQDQGQQQVHLQAAFVEFVHDHRVESMDVLENPEDHTGGRKEDLGRASGLAIVAHVVADLGAELSTFQLRYPLGETATGDPSGLDHQNFAQVSAPSGHLGGLARARGRRQHQGMTLKAFQKLGT